MHDRTFQGCGSCLLRFKLVRAQFRNVVTILIDMRLVIEEFRNKLSFLVWIKRCSTEIC